MKSKTLIGIAIASTFGWSAATFAGTGHEVVTPFSPNESGENIFAHQEGFSSTTHLSSVGSTSIDAGGTVSGSSDLGLDHSASIGDDGMSGMDNSLIFGESGSSDSDSLALADDGVYSDYYLVSWTPMTSDGWDYYLIDTGSNELAMSEDVYILTPVYDVIVFEDMSSDVSSDLGE